jgi:hypothetical protein
VLFKLWLCDALRVIKTNTKLKIAGIVGRENSSKQKREKKKIFEFFFKKFCC